MHYNLKLTIDGEPADVLEVRHTNDGSGFYRLMVRPKGATGGPQSQHDVPQLEGAFRTNGHDYRFGIERSGDEL